MNPEPSQETLSPLQQQIYLARVKLRPHQQAAVDALENANYKRLYLLWHRRAGKDYVSFFILLRQALKTRGNYIYCLPTYRLAKRVVFETIMSDSVRFLDIIPSQLVHKINVVDLSITLINGSIISVVGSNTIEKNLVGINPKGILYSEWSRSLNTSWQYLSPAIVQNNGFAIFITTPKGKNFAYEMWDRTSRDPKWFNSKKTVDDTLLVDQQTIMDERKEHGDDFVNQEYYCSFVAGEGTFYGSIINKLYLNDHITDVPEDPSLLTHTFMDIGYGDTTVVIYAQRTPGGIIRIIDCDYGNQRSLIDWCRLILSKPYNYGSHYAPHDAGHHDFGTGLTRFQQAEEVGLRFETYCENDTIKSAIPNVSLMAGIEKAMVTLPNCYFDEIKCDRLIKGLDNYRRDYDEKRSDFKDTPVHNADSHFADAFRYLALAINQTSKTITKEQLLDNYLNAKAKVVNPYENWQQRGFKDYRR